MVKKAKTTTAAKAKKIGRPKIDPADLRSVRFSFRMHPDLFDEIKRLSRIAGQPLSVYVERGAIERVHKDTGQELLDAIGRYRDVLGRNRPEHGETPTTIHYPKAPLPAHRPPRSKSK